MVTINFSISRGGRLLLDGNAKGYEVSEHIATKVYTISTVLFHKDEGANVAVTNCMSHFSMFVPTKATAKLANRNTGHAQEIGIILCRFTNCSVIYPVGPVYYCPGHTSNTISSGPLKFYIGF